SVILEHSWTEIFSGETITLRCDIQGAEGTQWTYEWKPDKFNSYPTSNKIWIKVTESDSGEYRCLGRRDTFSTTEWSEALKLTVSDKPRASLRADKTVIPAGGSITLTCSVDVSSGWKYYWYRHGSVYSEGRSINDQSDTVSVSEGGIYQCIGGRGGDPVFFTYISNEVTIKETDKPRASLNADKTVLPAGSSVTLTCSVKQSSGWKYFWYRDQTSSELLTTQEAVSLSDQQIRVSKEGEYWCRGGRGGRGGDPLYYATFVSMRQSEELKALEMPEEDYYNASYLIQLKALDSRNRPRASLRADKTVIPAGGSVTLTCSVDVSSGWKYYWYRRTSEYSGAQPINDQSDTVRVSEGGIYQCTGGRGDPVFYTYLSNEVTIKETVPSVTLQHSWPQIFIDETITLRCDIQGVEGRQWTYEWTHEWSNIPSISNEYRINRASSADSGEYRCRGRKENLSTTKWSEAFTLTVSSYKPRASLRADKTVIPPGGSVTLTCSVDVSSGWKYYWYRRTSESSEAQIIKSEASSKTVSVSEGGIYQCRGGRGGRGGDHVYYTEYSAAVTVEKRDSHKAVITQQPSWTQIFRGEKITLRCQIQNGRDTEWEFEWRTGSSQQIKRRGKLWVITASDSSRGQYWCRGKQRVDKFSSTEWSDPITLTVSAKPTAYLTADKSAVPAGGSVTLTCSVKQSSGWKYFWYRDQKSSEPLTTQEAVSLSDQHIRVSKEGEYWCRGGRGGRGGDPLYYTEYSQSVKVNKPDVEASSCPRTIHEKVGLTVQLSSCLPSEGVTVATWKYRTSTASGQTRDVTKVDQFKDRVGINRKDFSLTVRGLTLQDSGEFSFLSEVNDKQRETVTITLLVLEPITEVPVLKEINNTWIAYNESCTVWLDCTVTSNSTVTYNWTVRSQTFTGPRLRYILSPQEGATSFTCTASNIISEKSATTTVTCRNGTTTDHGNEPFPLMLILGVAGGGCLLIVIIVGLVVCVCCFKKRHTDSETNDLTVYADISEVTAEGTKPCSLYETIDNRVGAVTSTSPQTVYDQIQLNRMRKPSVSPYQDVS
ncbi:basement membrane-specific heparan sulfate proteoglycan core protein-like, partial [Parambassis ranga]|uniref:Basement membrane-specific heparan sulfate proteoglycan core protein-like n=1 Tax=Parambassis ranga TaxID=210632 RepID=A0A6P7I4S7_9TELE